jgi:outer membrane protein TolC
MVSIHAACAWICLVVTPAAALSQVQTDTVYISFNEIAGYAQRHSPRAAIIEQKHLSAIWERADALSWSNPEFSYQREDLEGVAETFFTARKEISLPWVSLSRRRQWNAQRDAAGHLREEALSEYMAEARIRYIELSLLRQQLNDLDSLYLVLARADSAVSGQFGEGYVSGVERHLIRMALTSLDSRRLERERSYHLLLGQWKADLGIPASQPVILTTRIVLEPAEVGREIELRQSIQQSPGYLAREKAVLAGRNRVSSARGGILPSIELSGGLKRQNSLGDGYTAGIALAFPLFNRNSAAVRKEEAQLELARYELDLFVAARTAEVSALLASIERLRESLEKRQPDILHDAEMMQSLAFAYQEGWISVPDLLNGVQIEFDGLTDYYQMLIDYYGSLLQLETFTGETFVFLE